MAKDPLETYRKKRDFRKTGEPSGKSRRKAGKSRRKAGKGRRQAGRRFVIQKHAARSLHYDFRLEADGVLKSWAVPKGPSTNPKDKRLAMPTEDHPLDYGGFEGVIPKGQYGGGAVIVWDRGTYRNLTEDDDGDEVPVSEALARGHLKIWLEGEKLRGGYALTRIGRGKDVRWLLVKMDDEEADARRNPVSTEPESVLTGRTVEEVAAEEGG